MKEILDLTNLIAFNSEMMSWWIQGKELMVQPATRLSIYSN